MIFNNLRNTNFDINFNKMLIKVTVPIISSKKYKITQKVTLYFLYIKTQFPYFLTHA